MPQLIISSDSTCDLSKEMVKEFNVRILPMIINFGLESYRDNVTLTPDQLYERVNKEGNLPKTSAISIGEYIEYFNGIKENKDDIILHFSISSGLSSTHQNACMAAEEVGNVFAFDSQNLSTGIALTILKACRMRDEGKSIEDILAVIEQYRGRVDASFVIDSLEYLYKGGRCSALALLGANIFNLKPCIEVKNGKMGVGKKYRGRFERVLLEYAKARLANAEIENEEVFITHAGCSEEVVYSVVELVKSFGLFKTIYITRAGCTVSTHCGHNTLGVLFVRK